MDNERAPARKAANGEDSIYWDASKKRYIGAISLGYTAAGKRNRAKVSGTTKTEVRRKLRELRKGLEKGAKTPAQYTVKQAVEDWLAQGLKGKASASVGTYRSLANTHIYTELGAAKLRLLEADDVDEWLDGRSAVLASTSLRLLLSILSRSIAHAQRRGKAVRNVAEVVEAPDGKSGRPSKSLSLDQGEAILRAGVGTWIHAYVVLSLLVGTRPEETRPLPWKHVHTAPADGRKPHVDVWRSVRSHGDTKTPKSRRSLAMPRQVAAVMEAHRKRQQAEAKAAGREWSTDDLVFPKENGELRTALDVRRHFRRLLGEAGIERPHEWTTRELRTTFVSLLSDHGIPIEVIARVVGHSGSNTTERVYRKQLRPVIAEGAEAMDEIFSGEEKEVPLRPESL
ncbi:tyrosine-type recombinase/integrase [Streptomyces sp. NBC_00555]|uniref:site-specific integrase n=1 Tax=Streptomyces sp. NBC_00555 TaxID=2903662 RepID=UPI002258693C|nr:tyrosine-type recombinase/integrase [Streptomyces sp. NBC_00555]MCX5014793.1 tyrosine-type recombinase/integrase [Streptomyces sp. NBC_00555]